MADSRWLVKRHLMEFLILSRQMPVSDVERTRAADVSQAADLAAPTLLDLAWAGVVSQRTRNCDCAGPSGA
jgi:hypothetical protein